MAGRAARSHGYDSCYSSPATLGAPERKERKERKEHMMKLNDLVCWMAISVVVAAAPAVAVAAEAFSTGNTHNGLSAAAFRRNALTTNSDALTRLLRHGLSSALFTDEPYLATQLHDPRARAMMTEIVRCALAPSAPPVTFVDALGGGATYVWSGELGLCAHASMAVNDWQRAWPTWDGEGPNESCQQLVTACVLARVNALRAAIPISLRGDPAALFPIAAQVQTETIFREGPTDQDPNEGAQIGSFGGPMCPVGHECNWVPGFVGKCSGGPIQLGFQDPAASGSTALRVCAGIHGCYGPSPGWTMPPRYPVAPEQQYSRLLTEVRPGGASITFTCPAGVPTGGFYSVMARSSSLGNRQARQPAPAVVQRAGVGSYPATEREVFGFLEGAFYGNLFEPGELAWQCQMSGDTRVCQSRAGKVEACGAQRAPTTTAGCVESDLRLPYSNVYACFSYAQQQDAASDEQGAAYVNDRICDQPNPDVPCFPHKPKRCYYSDSSINATRGARCQWDSAAGVFRDCQGADGTAYPPITTYLNEPCDLLGSSPGAAELCRAVRRATPATHASIPGVRPGARGCGGCSSITVGGVPPASLAGLLALGCCLRRRRTR
jgi:hypothetical protein